MFRLIPKDTHDISEKKVYETSSPRSKSLVLGTVEENENLILYMHQISLSAFYITWFQSRCNYNFKGKMSTGLDQIPQIALFSTAFNKTITCQVGIIQYINKDGHDR